MKEQRFKFIIRNKKNLIVVAGLTCASDANEILKFFNKDKVKYEIKEAY